MPKSSLCPPPFSRRLLGAVLLFGLSGCMQTVDAPPVSVVFFTPFSTDLDGTAEQVLDHVAVDAKAGPARTIVIEGFADRTITTPAQNRTIAEERAQAVADGLVTKGVERSRIVLRPRGATKSDPGVESRRVDISFAR